MRQFTVHLKTGIEKIIPRSSTTVHSPLTGWVVTSTQNEEELGAKTLLNLYLPADGIDIDSVKKSGDRSPNSRPVIPGAAVTVTLTTPGSSQISPPQETSIGTHSATKITRKNFCIFAHSIFIALDFRVSV
jgi:hypothetical protein